MNDSSHGSVGGDLRWLSRLLVVACFCASGILTAWVINTRLPFPAVPDIGVRFRYFTEKKDEFDTVFIGSSRVRHQVIPHEFDAETAAGGLETHSINLGYSGMWPPESFYFLSRVLALHPRHLRWVVIELMDHRPGQADHLPVTMRMVYWHDWQHTVRAWRMVVESPLAPAEKIQQLALHGWLLAERTVNPGRGTDWLRERYFPTKQKMNMSWVQRAGFDPEEKTVWTAEARADYARQIQVFEQAATPRRMRPGLVADLREISAAVRAAGAEPIFVLPPSVLASENIIEGLPPGVAVWAYNNPVEYPRLYLPELHHDPEHLNEDGAREFTSLLAQRLVEWTQKH